MWAAAALSAARGYITAGDQNRIRDLIAAYDLPTRPEATSTELAQAIRKDKKREGARIHFVYLESVGRAVVETVTLDDLAAALALSLA